ncbi:hypothetical protein KPH14_006562 [Odynerus spinipes]|uniref:Uncharacterized protein n=1 Tax=Odynerus spinipes TaxID=1348599 RepID=A0AAD9RQS0_9HYME|nr:hypothetical protein KPH14_006562 [Odynerus spinipes]
MQLQWQPSYCKDVTGCWEASEAGTCLRVGVAVARRCVEVRASLRMGLVGLEIQTMSPECRQTLQFMLRGDGEPLPPVIIKVAPSYRRASNSAILRFKRKDPQRPDDVFGDSPVSSGWQS